MRKLTSLLAAVVMISAIASAHAENYVRVGQAEFSYDGTAVNPGDVYGELTLRIAPFDGSTIAAQLELLSKAIVGKYQNRSGSYLLTLEGLRGETRILTIPLISITYDERTKFLFFKVSEKATKEVTVNGLVRVTEPITYQNNEVQLVLRSYYKKTSSFDMSIFDLFNTIQNDYSLLSAVDSSGVGARVVKTVTDALDQALRQSEEMDTVFRYGMKFAHLGNVAQDLYRAGWVNIDFAARYGSAQKHGRLRVNIKTWSKSSIFRHKLVNGEFKFNEPLASVVLGNAALSKEIPIFDFIRGSGPTDVRRFLEALLSPEGYKGGNVETECVNLLASFRKFLSNRDAVALFWATLQEYRSKYKQASAVGCVSQRRQEFQTYGLPIEELDQYFAAQ